MKKFVYFVSFSYVNDNGFGFGEKVVNVDKRIDSADDIITLVKYLEDDERSVVPLNFILLRIDDDEIEY